ncbi:MAG: hypothetical protein K0S33_2325 [Bacteroidetes bacterium]|jgi:hypothetical protein|nr:hypothetical protein [Bacteroidota bacterium]
MTPTHFIKTGFLVLVLTASVAFKGDKDKLHKRDFTVQLTEGKKPKPSDDEVSFKDGKIYCGDVLNEKNPDLSWMRYEIKVDSTYIEDDVEKEYIEIIATKELERADMFEVKCVIDDHNIEGSMRIHKNNKDKKTFSFTGKEKPKKEKEKKKKDE